MTCRSRTLALLLGLALLTVACGGASAEVEVRMLDNTYAPEVVEVDPGESVAFRNAGRVPHNVIAVDRTFNSVDDTGDNTQPGETWTLTVDEEGVYEYYCSLHATQDDDGQWQGMVGTLIVGDAADVADVAAAESTAPSEWTGETRRVPEDYPTIQAGVDAADPGDLVLVGPGVYREAVSVTTPGLTIRGSDRNGVILDGEFTRENGIVATADGVAVENMTARNYTVNGFFWNGVTGYRGSYLTAIDDWVYGIYAFDSVDGLFEHSYASGSWDAGFYIGQCDPCNAVITDVVAEFNGLGYSGTNASGNIWIVDSEWRNNVAGIVPNTLDSELLPPANNVVVAGNYIHDNGEDERAPNMTAEWSAFGNGVLLAGVRDSVVRNNLIVNSPTSGVQVVSMIDENFWPSGGNEVRDNVIRGSGRSDLALGGPLEQGSCFADNDGDSAVPFMLTWLHDCEGINIPLWYGLATASEPLGRIAQVNAGQNTQLEHGEAPKPELDFEGLPGGADAPVMPAVDVFNSLDFDPDAITTPEMPEGISFDDERLSLFGITFASGFWPVLYGALLWWIPVLVWFLGTIWAIRKEVTGDKPVWAKAGWSTATVVIPTVGVIAYTGLAAEGWSWRRRLTVAIGGTLAWLLLVVAALLIGGVF